ncbi:MAG: DinB family protein [Deltaproteobacteria bacterium]|jgi:hypothetical protein|nr:DinB family protein [Deltaproteobacteria bacterium]
MSRQTVDSLASSAYGALDLLSALIDAASDNLWEEKIGGWPLWQHLIHALWGNDFFTPGPAAPAPEGLSAEVLQLKTIGTQAPAKERVKIYLRDVRTKIEGFVSGLDDAGLVLPNEKTKAIGLDWDITKTMVILSSHPYYHLGYGDTLLRNHGLAGVF